MRRLTTGILSEKCVLKRFHRCANVYLHILSIANYTPRLYGIACCSLSYKPVQHITVLNTVDIGNTVVNIIIIYFNIIFWDHRRICGPSLTEK